MKTAYTKEIDGLNIVLGLDQERIDQVETERKIKPIIENTKEFKVVKSRLLKIKTLTIANDSLRKNASRISQRVANNKGCLVSDILKSDFSSTEIESLNNYDNLYKNNIDQISAYERDLKNDTDNLRKKKSEIIKSDGVYFNILKNEIKITDKQATDFLDKLKTIKGQKRFLKTDGIIIDDFRGQQFFDLHNGSISSLKISRLDETVDFSIYKRFIDLTEEEKEQVKAHNENERINEMSESEKEIEKNMFIESALIQAANERNKLEIIGDADALKKSQKIYKNEVKRIQEKYK